MPLMAVMESRLKYAVFGMVVTLLVVLLVQYKFKTAELSNMEKKNNEIKSFINNVPRPFRYDPTASVPANTETYLRYAQSTDIICNQSVRMGSAGDGGWDVCIVPPFNMKSGCLVYDFGIDNVWTFDDAIADKFGCKVRTFDPYCGLKRHDRTPLIPFYPIGLSWQNEEPSKENKNVTLKTLLTLMTELDSPNVILDYLKIDIEWNEWPALQTMFKDGFLPKQVKQIGIEVHAGQNDLESHIKTFDTIYDLGFRKWKSHINPLTYARVPGMSDPIPFCHEMYYINTNFMSIG